MRITIAVAGVLALAVQASAADGGLERLAPPGPCAEAELPRAEPELFFDVSGGPREHFDPRDVASGPSAPLPGPPERPDFERTPCDAPTTGCADILVGRQSGGVVVEPPPNPGTGPPFGRFGAGDDQ